MIQFLTATMYVITGSQTTLNVLYMDFKKNFKKEEENEKSKL